MIFFFYGEDGYRSEVDVRKIKEQYLEKNPTGAGFHFFDCEEGVAFSDIVGAMGVQSLFATKQLLVVKNFFGGFSSEEQKEMIPYLERASQDVIVFWEQGASPRKNAKLFTWLTKNAQKNVAYTYLSGASLQKWITDEIALLGGSLESSALQSLQLLGGEDLSSLKGCLVQLVSYADGRAVTSSDVKLFVRRPAQGDIFGVTEAMMGGDKAKALKLVANQVAAGDDVHYIFSMFVYQVRTLLQVAGFYYDGTRDKAVIAKACKLHPFVVQKAMGVLSRTDKKRIVAAHDYLLGVDVGMKNGTRDMAYELERFLMHA